MKKMEKAVALLLAALLAVGMRMPAAAYSADDYDDVPTTHWAYPNIMELVNAGIVKGVGDGRYAPAETLTTGSFLALVGRALYPADVNEAGTSVWWETYYQAAAQKGIVLGDELSGTAADMERGITRNEMARIMVRVDESVNRNQAVNADTFVIPDYNNISVEFQPFAAQAYAKGLLTGDEHGNFNGENTLRRDEAATVIKRLLDAQKRANAELPPFTVDITSFNAVPTFRGSSLTVTGAVGTVAWVTSDPTVVAIWTTENGRHCGFTAMAKGTSVITGTDEAGRMVTCTVVSTYEPPAPSKMTGEYVTIKFYGTVELFNRGASYPAGVSMTMKALDGRVLGTATSYGCELNERGTYSGASFTFEVTMDKADFVTTRDAYRMECTYIAADGNHYSNINAGTREGAKFTLEPRHEFLQPDPNDFTGQLLSFDVMNTEGEFLDF